MSEREVRAIAQVRTEYLSARSILANLEGRLAGRPRRPPLGYLPAEIDYTARSGDVHTLRIRDYDVRFIDRVASEEALDHLELIHKARRGDEGARSELKRRAGEIVRRLSTRFSEPELVQDEFVIPYTAKGEYSEDAISQKGAILLDLSRRGIGTADFSLLSAKAYLAAPAERDRQLERTIRNLEILSGRRLDNRDDPLLVAVRSALPEYLPGVMPTYLNAGLTPRVLPGLPGRYGADAAARIRLGNRKTLLEALDPEAFAALEPKMRPGLTRKRTIELAEACEALIREREPRLLDSAIEQLRFLLGRVYAFYDSRFDALRNFMVREVHYPSVIFQRMVCSVIDERSYAGVLYSRHPRRGRGVFLQFGRTIYGEDLMTGRVPPEERHFLEREEAREEFPAVYHFWHRLSQLEDIFRGPVMVEFTAVHGTFTTLQVNAAELAGAGMLTAVMDLHRARRIGAERVRELIKPYHVRQIESDAIDPKSLQALTPFARGLSVLPRAAVTGRVTFSAVAAGRAKAERPGENVILVKDRFTPQDAVDMPKVGGICSLSPAAIHVVTTAQNLGIPSLLNLAGDGVKIDLKNGQMSAPGGRKVREGDWVTISSRQRTLFLGKAVFAPARLLRFMAGEPVAIDPEDRSRFEQLAADYAEYRAIQESVGAAEFESLQDLGHALRYGRLKGDPQAADFVNRCYDINEPSLARKLLESTLGTHLVNLAAFEVLAPDRQARLLKSVLALTSARGLSGYEAGAFVIGSLVRPEWRLAFWRSFTPAEIARLIDEWILHQKYMDLMSEADEGAVRRARDRILSRGLRPLNVDAGLVKGFMTLKLSRPDWIRVRSSLTPAFDPQTAEALEVLGRPYAAFIDFADPRSRAALSRICEAEGLPLPRPDDR